MAMVNAAAFILVWADKRRAGAGRWRVSERMLLLFGLAGGSAGLYMAMRIFHHKTRKMKFALGVPLLMIAQAGLILFFVLK